MKKKFILVIFVFFCFALWHYKDFLKEFCSSIVLMKLEKSEKQKLPFYLINVLDREEFDDAHIIGSIHVCFEEVSSFLEKIKDKDVPLIFYCSNYYCTASDESAKIAFNKGFTDVSVYKGGMAEWYQASLEDKDFLYSGPAISDYLKIVVLPKKNMISDEEENCEKSIKIISINYLQNFLKQSNLIK